MRFDHDERRGEEIEFAFYFKKRREQKGGLSFIIIYSKYLPSSGWVNGKTK
jgi:hypothetical protein